MGTDAAFAALGLPAGASPIEITRAFRALCRRGHPDVGGDRTRFETVLDAYRTLQRHGLVQRTRTERMGRDAGADVPPTASTTETPVSDHTAPGSAGAGARAADFYRRFVASLDQVAAMAEPRRRIIPCQRMTPEAARFEDVLERELRRLAA